ncbi:hypothetical protein PhCBS80983_g01182 [Powellomyces hirtus]|uniref:Protein kinase domain-containing protein n=1 Tax=Powellomyces hirtus TaxID=109895 RepID=A0A507EDX3_9FUNG|nr:hypothetical protein PhCBS80983_g01182 [Powellomyces hirtus]
MHSPEPQTRHRQGSITSGLSSKFAKKHSHHNSHHHHLLHHHLTHDIQDYELISDIGGVDDISYLYLAKHIPTGESVALKYTDLTLSPDYELIDELIRTVRNTNLCQHRNILPYYTTFVETERMWNVTVAMKAGSFRSIMQNHFSNGFSDAIVATILREVLHAIVYMHDNKMIHNDIRADNILLGDHGEIRITGLRQMVSLAREGVRVGSVFSAVGDNIEWAAPEVMAQNTNYDSKVDIYSLGITALELAFNKTPFDDWPPLKVLLSKLDYPCPAITAETKHPSRDFWRFVCACVQKDPSKRPTARDLLDHAFLKQCRSLKYLDAHVWHKMLSSSSSPPLTRTASSATDYTQLSPQSRPQSPVAQQEPLQKQVVVAKTDKVGAAQNGNPNRMGRSGSTEEEEEEEEQEEEAEEEEEEVILESIESEKGERDESVPVTLAGRKGGAAALQEGSRAGSRSSSLFDNRVAPVAS